MTFVDISNGKLVHACSEFIKTISRYFGRNFWKLKVKFSVEHIQKFCLFEQIKPLYVAVNSPTPPDENLRRGI